MIPPVQCYFESVLCHNDLLCEGCSHNPPAEEKPNGKRTPLPLIWEPDIEGRGLGWPICPACGEMPYSTERCFFCGQLFEEDEKLRAYKEPAPEESYDCLACGSSGAVVGRRSRANDHFHGKCTVCGAIVFE